MLFRLIQSDGSLQAQRESIIYSLNKKLTLVQMDVSIVFDATYQLGDGSRGHFDHLEILYTAHGENADDFIIKKLQMTHSPEREVVVTCDRELTRRARACSAQTETINEFQNKLHRSYVNRLKPTTVKTNRLPPLLLKQVPVLEINREKSEDDYADIFEKKWQQILEEEKTKELQKKTKKEQIYRPKGPKKPRKNLFEEEITKEVKEKNEMERWLKLFENK